MNQPGEFKYPKWMDEILTQDNKILILRDSTVLEMKPEEILNDLINIGKRARALFTQTAVMGMDIDRRIAELKAHENNPNRKPQEPEPPEEQDTRTPEERRAEMRRLAGLDKKETN